MHFLIKVYRSEVLKNYLEKECDTWDIIVVRFALIWDDFINIFHGVFEVIKVKEGRWVKNWWLGSFEFFSMKRLTLIKCKRSAKMGRQLPTLPSHYWCACVIYLFKDKQFHSYNFYELHFALWKNERKNYCLTFHHSLLRTFGFSTISLLQNHPSMTHQPHLASPTSKVALPNIFNVVSNHRISHNNYFEVNFFVGHQSWSKSIFLMSVYS